MMQELMMAQPAAMLALAALLGGAYTLLGLAVLARRGERGRLPGWLGATVAGFFALLLVWPLAASVLWSWPGRARGA